MGRMVLSMTKFKVKFKVEKTYDVEVEGRLKQIEADVKSLAISVANVEKSLGQLQTIDDLTEALPEPEGLEARFNKLVNAVGKQIQVPKDI